MKQKILTFLSKLVENVDSTPGPPKHWFRDLCVNDLLLGVISIALAHTAVHLNIYAIFGHRSSLCIVGVSAMVLWFFTHVVYQKVVKKNLKSNSNK